MKWMANDSENSPLHQWNNINNGRIDWTRKSIAIENSFVLFLNREKSLRLSSSRVSKELFVRKSTQLSLHPNLKWNRREICQTWRTKLELHWLWKLNAKEISGLEKMSRFCFEFNRFELIFVLMKREREWIMLNPLTSFCLRFSSSLFFSRGLSRFEQIWRVFHVFVENFNQTRIELRDFYVNCTIKALDKRVIWTT